MTASSTIGDDLAGGLRSVQALTLRGSPCETIEVAAFPETGPAEVTPGSSALTTASRAFGHCTSLTEAMPDKTVQTFGDYAADYSCCLAEVTISDSAWEIDGSASTLRTSPAQALNDPVHRGPPESAR